jgi:hypothetical protein
MMQTAEARKVVHLLFVEDDRSVLPIDAVVNVQHVAAGLIIVSADRALEPEVPQRLQPFLAPVWRFVVCLEAFTIKHVQREKRDGYGVSFVAGASSTDAL